MGKRIATAYSYTRFSSPEQAKGDSIRRQTNLRDAWLLKSGAMLDTSIVLRDAGVSAFSGGHRDNPDRHALAAFLELVKKGRIPKGSFLIVESLDRLTREHIRPALVVSWAAASWMEQRNARTEISNRMRNVPSVGPGQSIARSNHHFRQSIQGNSIQCNHT